MKNTFLKLTIALTISGLLFYNPAKCQEETDTTVTEEVTTEEEVEPQDDSKKPERPAFESNYVINQNTVEVPTAKTLEFLIQHRFGKLNSGTFDLLGLYGAANMRMSVSYSINDRFALGLGTTKLNKQQDLNWKAALLKQTRGGSIPVSVTYGGNVAIDVRKDIFPSFANRLSYYHELLIARRFNSALSLQVSGTYSHFNILDSANYPGLKHSNFGVAFMGRYKFSSQSSVLFEYAMPLTTPESIKPNLGIGYEVATSGHAFQVFISTYDALIPQHDYTFNENNFLDRDILLGFNITRLWGF